MSKEADVRAAWLSRCAAISHDAIARKQSQDALVEFERHYQLLTPDERAIVDRLLAEQVQSDDENVRFDALALVNKFKIRSADPALRRLADRLTREHHPGAPYERAKVNGILASTTPADGRPHGTGGLE